MNTDVNKGRPIHSRQRALAKLIVGATKQRESAIARVEGSKLREEIFTFQVAMAGIGNALPSWQSADLQFPSPMVPAPLQRDSDLDVPQFWYGSHLYSSSAPVVLTAHISQWFQDEAEYTTGALVSVGAYTPGQNDDVEFAGYLHLTFQGYSSPVLNDDDTEDS